MEKKDEWETAEDCKNNSKAFKYLFGFLSSSDIYVAKH